MKLESLLSSEDEHLRQLVTLLRQEQECLVQPKVDGPELTRLADQKKQQLMTLETLELQRQGMMRQQGFEQGTEAARANGCMAAWESLQHHIEEAALLNQLNGGLIRQRMMHNQHMLNTLREMSGHSLYQPDGQQDKPGARLASKA